LARSSSDFKRQKTVNILLLTRYDRLGASSRLRSLQFLHMFREAGMTYAVQPLFSDEVLKSKYKTGAYGLDMLLLAYLARIKQLMQRNKFDLVWIEKEALPWLPAWFEKILLRGTPYVLDYDDALFHNYDLHRYLLVRALLGKRLDDLMAGARLVTCGNDYLAQRARAAGAPWVEIVPTVIDLDRYTPKPSYDLVEAVPKIVWIGSPSTIQYLIKLEEPLSALAKKTPFKFKLRVIGGTITMQGVDVECVPWTEDTEVQNIAECDVGIMPLNDSPWERGKCGYKLIQYMACGLPVVASPVGVNTQIVQDGFNGFLAEESDAWVAKLGQLLGDTALRAKMGGAGRQRVVSEYCIQQVGPRLINLLQKAGER
jgi:glycosyltransferase involved in cell wall biosynthesis